MSGTETAGRARGFRWSHFGTLETCARLACTALADGSLRRGTSRKLRAGTRLYRIYRNNRSRGGG